MRSIRARLIVWLILGITLFLATSGVAIHAIVSSQLRGDFDRSLLTTARSLAPVLRRDIARSLGVSTPDPPGRPAATTERTDILFEMRDSDGEVFLRSDRLAGEGLPRLAEGAEPTSFAPDTPLHLEYADIELPPESEGETAARPGRALAFVLGPPPRTDLPDRLLDPRRPGPGRRLRERLGEGAPVLPGGRARAGLHDGQGPLGRGLGRFAGERFEVVLAGDTTQLLVSLRRLRLVLLLAWLVCSLGCAGILAWVVQHSLQPLGRLSRQIEDLGSDGLRTRFALPDAPAELEPVVAELNLLLARLQEAFDREQAFTADAAHELRTPLAGLRSTLELALSRERSGPEYRRSAETSLAITEQMQGLVADLLTLSRMASDEVEPRREDTTLAAAFAAARAPFDELATQRGISLRVEEHGDTAFATDPALVQRVLSNLVENAVSYGDAGVPIEARLRGDAEQVSLEITNGVKDAPDDLAEKAFLAFWRADRSRSMTDDHAGLGLSICKRIVERLGGSLVASLEGERFRVYLSLPRHPR